MGTRSPGQDEDGDGVPRGGIGKGPRRAQGWEQGPQGQDRDGARVPGQEGSRGRTGAVSHRSRSSGARGGGSGPAAPAAGSGPGSAPGSPWRGRRVGPGRGGARPPRGAFKGPGRARGRVRLPSLPLKQPPGQGGRPACTENPGPEHPDPEHPPGPEQPCYGASPRSAASSRAGASPVQSVRARDVPVLSTPPPARS